MQEFHHESEVVYSDDSTVRKISNCHDTYVNLVNDKLAAITFTTAADFSLVQAELKSLARRLRTLVKKFSKSESNTKKLEQFIKNTAYKNTAINELAQLIDPDMGYIYPEHIKAFIEIILQERIKAFRTDIADKFNPNELQSEHHSTQPAITTNATKQPLLSSKISRQLLMNRIGAKHGIKTFTMKPEYDLILKIVRAVNLINNGSPCEDLITEIYSTVGLHEDVFIPILEDKILASQLKHCEILENLKTLLNDSFFTIDKFLTLDIESRWHIVTHKESIFDDENNYTIDVLTANADALQTFIKCKLLIMEISQGKKRHEECRYVFESLGLHSVPEQYISDLETVCYTISYILVPFNIELALYNTFDPSSLLLALYKGKFHSIISESNVCPVKLLQLHPDTLNKLFIDQLDIAYRCEQAGITMTELIDLPKKEVEMIIDTPYYIARLPVLTRAYYLPAQHFLDASIEQKEIWLKRPASVKSWFNSQNLTLNTAEFKEALQIISKTTTPILEKFVATEALLYLKELLLTPWLIVEELQKIGFKYNQCRVIFKVLLSLNSDFIDHFTERFTKESTIIFSHESIEIDKVNLHLRLGNENALIAWSVIEDYVTALMSVLDATKSDTLADEFDGVLESNNQDEIVSNIADKLYDNNLFCKHLRLYKKTKNEKLLKKLHISDVPYISNRYHSGDVKMFSLIFENDINYPAIYNELQTIAYDARNTQEISLYGCAVGAKDLPLINVIATSIKSRSEVDIQQFLIENGFKKPPTSKNLLSASPFQCLKNPKAPQNLLFAFPFKSFKKPKEPQGDLNHNILNVKHHETGDTPLLTAIRQGNSKIALALILWDADLEVRDNDGLTPGMLATKLDLETAVVDIYYKIQHNLLLEENLAAHNSTSAALSL